MPENLTPGSPAWWLNRLNRRLDKRRPTLQKLEDYYEGRHPLIFATERFTQVFGSSLMPYADNFVSRLVDVITERLFVDGFRFGNDEAAADEAWRIWQANRMDTGSQLLFREALVKGEAAVIVWTGDDRDTPRISVEDPAQVIVETAPGDRLRRLAALKRWTEDRVTYATLYLPDGIYKFQSASNSDMVAMGLGPEYGSWDRRQVADEPWPLRNPLGVVPVVPVLNRPKMNGIGRSEIEPVIPLQDAINKTGADMLVASEYGAFRQRWATGLDIPVDPDTGQPFETFQAMIERLWTTADPNVKFGEFGETNLDNYVKAINMQVQHFSSVGGIPLHYLLSSGVTPSGESQTAAESPLVSKARDRSGDYSDPLEEVERLVFLVKDEPQRAAAHIETGWRDPERRTPSEFVDSLVKELALGVPPEMLWEKRGYTRQEIERIKTINEQRELASEVRRAQILEAMLAQGASPDIAARVAALGGRSALPALSVDSGD